MFEVAKILDYLGAETLYLLGNTVLRTPGKVFHALPPFQYAVPVIKYDRKGYKARARQLLLTPDAAVLAEESKIKQQIDYGNLTGREATPSETASLLPSRI